MYQAFISLNVPIKKYIHIFFLVRKQRQRILFLIVQVLMASKQRNQNPNSSTSSNIKGFYMLPSCVLKKFN